jgi:hypothetical protein
MTTKAKTVTPERAQPATLDTKVKIEDDAPLAMGHDEGTAAAHREANEQLKAAVDSEEGQPEVGPRAAGDHAEAKKKKGSD